MLLAVGPPANASRRSLEGHAPILQLETGFHTAAIRQAALSQDGRTLATAAEDKTLRVWDTEPLRLRRVIHTPQGPGVTGKLYALALTPDGSLAATSGYTGERGSGRHRIFILDLRDGRLIHEIAGLPQVINFLSISPDGQRLVAHLGGTSGLRVFRIADGAEVGRAPNFGAPTFAGAFSKEGSYLATSDDGFLRLFSPEFKLIAQVKAPAPGPFRVSYRPDGQTIALGYADGCRVDVLSSKTLFPLYTADCKGAQGPLAVVGWSLDGTKLYAGGGVDFGAQRNDLRCWEEGGRGGYKDAPLAWATLADLLPLPGGELLAATQDPALLWLGPDLKPKALLSALPGDLAKVGENLKVDSTGSSVSLEWRFPDKHSLVFSIPNLELRTQAEDLLATPSVGPGFDLTSWKNSEQPMLGGKPLTGLEAHETVRSASLARDGQSFVLGTDWNLRSFQIQGRPLAFVPLPAAAWGLNHTPDGKHLVAALADGTVRWYRCPELTEVLALFLHPDGQRWVCWNPKGFYATSVAGEELLGWLIQKEGETGEFFPCEKFREAYFNPALLASSFGSVAVSPAVPPPAAEPIKPSLPPLLRVLRPLDRASFTPGNIAFQVSVRSYGARDEVRKVHVYLDGAKLPAIDNPLPGAWVEADQVFDTLYTLQVPVQVRQDCHVGLAVETTQGTSKLVEVALQYLVPAVPASAPVAVEPSPIPLPVVVAPTAVSGVVTPPPSSTVVPAPALPAVAAPLPVATPVAPVPAPSAQAPVAIVPIPSVPAMPRAPRLNLVAIGVADYGDPAISLRFPAKDARDLAAVFAGAKTTLYSEVDLRLVLNAQATRAGVMEAIGGLKERARPEDVSILFISGHGATSPGTGTYFFVPYDFIKGDYKALLDGREIQKLLGQTQGKVVMLMDTCHSGNVMGEGRLRGLEDVIRLTRFINELTSAENGVTVFSSSTGSQVSLESTAWNNGAFTKALVEGLGGKADPEHTGRITLSMLDAYLRTRVVELTQGRQTPVSGKPDSKADYPLTLSR